MGERTRPACWGLSIHNKSIQPNKNKTQVNAGMLRLYEGEVLGKLPVIQHFLFRCVRAVVFLNGGGKCIPHLTSSRDRDRHDARRASPITHTSITINPYARHATPHHPTPQLLLPRRLEAAGPAGRLPREPRGTFMVGYFGGGNSEFRWPLMDPSRHGRTCLTYLAYHRPFFYIIPHEHQQDPYNRSAHTGMESTRAPWVRMYVYTYKTGTHPLTPFNRPSPSHMPTMGSSVVVRRI